MRQLFLCVLSLSLSGALTGLVILLLRPLTGKCFSRRWSYYIWLVLIVRLILPVHFETGVGEWLSVGVTEQERISDSLLQAEEVSSMSAAAADVEDASAGQAANPAEQTALPHRPRVKAEGAVVHPLYAGDAALSAVCVIWLVGAALSLTVKMMNYRNFNRRIRKDSQEVTDAGIHLQMQELCRRLSLKRTPALCESASVSSPLTVGPVRPVIVLPLREEDPKRRILILHHELIHVKRRDLWYKWLYQLLLCIHWFNPVVYLAGRAFNRDCELSCDEAVLGLLTREGKRAYGNLLINTAERDMGMDKNMFSTTLLERKGDLKERLKGILRYKKQGRSRAAVSLCAALAVALFSACGSVQAGPQAMPLQIAEKSTPEKAGTDACASADEVSSFGEDSAWTSFWGKLLDRVFDYDVDDFLKTRMAVSHGGKAWKAYDDDTLLAGKDISGQRSAFIYSGGSRGVTCSGLLLNGSETILIEKVQEESELQIDIAFELLEGRFKIIYVSPDGEVETLNETGESTSRTIGLKEGRNVIKMVGQGGKLKALEIRFDRTQAGSAGAVYYSEAEEYGDLVLEEIAKEGQADKKALLAALPYMEAEKVSQVLGALLENGIALDGQELSDFLIYSDARTSGQYLAEAVRDGKYTFTDEDALEDVIIYLDEEKACELLLALTDTGTTLTWSQFSRIAPYLSEETIRKIDERLWQNQNK